MTLFAGVSAGCREQTCGFDATGFAATCPCDMSYRTMSLGSCGAIPLQTHRPAFILLVQPLLQLEYISKATGQNTRGTGISDHVSVVAWGDTRRSALSSSVFPIRSAVGDADDVELTDYH